MASNRRKVRDIRILRAQALRFHGTSAEIDYYDTALLKLGCTACSLVRPSDFGRHKKPAIFQLPAAVKLHIVQAAGVLSAASAAVKLQSDQAAGDLSAASVAVII